MHFDLYSVNYPVEQIKSLRNCVHATMNSHCPSQVLAVKANILGEEIHCRSGCLTEPGSDRMGKETEIGQQVSAWLRVFRMSKAYHSQDSNKPGTMMRLQEKDRRLILDH